MARKEGYLSVDHRFSPGISAELIHAAGLTGIIDPAKADKHVECATATCHHCNAVVILRPDRKRPRGYCPKCDGYICDNAACGLECRNFEKLLDTLQEQAARASTIGSY